MAYFSTACEAFGCLPLPGGMVDQPIGLIRRIMLFRRYKQAVDMRERRVPVPPEGPPEWADVMAAQVFYQRREEDEARDGG